MGSKFGGEFDNKTDYENFSFIKKIHCKKSQQNVDIVNLFGNIHKEH